MEQETVKGLVHIVSSKANKDINLIRKSGENWYNYFVENKLWSKKNSVLEYGAGVGRLSIPFNRLAKVTAIDGNPNMVQYLKENGIDAYLSNNCDPVMNRRFDFAISTYVLQHMHFPNAQNLVKQISQVTDVFYFTYPIIELGAAETYIYYKYSYDVDILKSHNVSRKMHLNELPILFETSNFNSNKITSVFSNLFKIEK
jgi:2-polyprenyl-3-methyl-5-hydroxy-6-metoxy-1,4-benzoquinol methylase